MTLMVGSSPFGGRAAGRFNFVLPERPHRYLEPCPRRIRGVRGGRTVVDTLRACFVSESDHLGVWGFVPEDVDLAALEDVVVRRDEPDLAGFVFVGFDDLDEWYEEDERVFGHPRDPYSRIDIIPTSRQVRVSLDGRVLADTTRARALFETGLPARWYIPQEDVRMDLLTPAATRSRCAYKGLASYWDLGSERALCWSYPDPMWDAERVRDRVCFFDERVDIELDGVAQKRPTTPWRTDAWVDVPERTGDAKDFG